LPEGASVEGVIALAGAIRNSATLVKLLMSENKFNGAEAGKILGDAVAANTVLQELTLSRRYTKDYTEAEAKTIPAAVDEEFLKEFMACLFEGASSNTTMTSLDLSGNPFGSSKKTVEGVTTALEECKYVGGVVQIKYIHHALHIYLYR
jgi:hypothetical protein